MFIDARSGGFSPPLLLLYARSFCFLLLFSFHFILLLYNSPNCIHFSPIPLLFLTKRDRRKKRRRRKCSVTAGVNKRPMRQQPERFKKLHDGGGGGGTMLKMNPPLLSSPLFFKNTQFLFSSSSVELRKPFACLLAAKREPPADEYVRYRLIF